MILKLALTIAVNADNDKDKRNRQPLNHLAADPDAHADERVLEIKNLDKLGPEWEGWTPEAQEHRRKEVEKIKADAAKMTASSIQLLVANTILHGERRDGETRLTLIARPELAEAALEQVNKMTLERHAESSQKRFVCPSRYRGLQPRSALRHWRS